MSSPPFLEPTDPSASSSLPGAGGAPPRSGPRTAATRLSLLLVAVLAGAALFVGGFSLGARVATTPGTPAAEEASFQPFWDVYNLIRENYAGSPKPTQQQLMQAAIKAMVASLNDPWSYYQGPEDFQQALQNVGGQGEGIGVQIQLERTTGSGACSAIGGGCALVVVAPIVGSPADKAGVQAGDAIVGADGKSFDGLSLEDAVARIKGPRGTPIRLTLLRQGRTMELTIVRNVFDQPEVATRIVAGGTVEVLQVAGVNDVAASQLDAALKVALAAGRRSFVLDLRGNPGGSVKSAARLAGEFLAGGTIAWQEDASGKLTEITAATGGRATDPSIRLAVLMDKNTASAAEILAGALQARGRAILVGQRSYGKGVAQEWMPLPNDLGGIHLTIARWLTPNKVWINGKGLTPDVPIAANASSPSGDPALDAALTRLGHPSQPAGPSPTSTPTSTASTSQSGLPSAAPSAP